MKERPILFSGPMVKAILEGRKTVTRRVIRVPPEATPECQLQGPHELLFALESGGGRIVRVPCAIGDRLWVRETFALIWPGESPPDNERNNRIEYRADTDAKYPGGWPDDSQEDSMRPKWRPSIHMPRWASRLTLEVTDVRVERLQAMKESDALVEGIGSPITRDCKLPKFRTLWDGLNGKRAPWDSNPWVWVISFKRLDSQAGAA